MIDFRYHVVSLISVFLALAVGIALGAGPLEKTIGDSLTGQVEVLREDRDALRAELDAAQSSLDRQAVFLEGAAPQLLEGTLTDRRVAVVSLGPVEEDARVGVEERLVEAGASVSARVQVNDQWTDPSVSAFREGLTDDLATHLDPASGGAAGVEDELADALVQGLTSSAPGAPGQLSDSAGLILELLSTGESELITLPEPVTAPADTIVILAADPVGAGEAAATGETATPAEADAAAESLDGYLALVASAQQGSEGALLAGGVATPGDLVSTVLEDSVLAARISTVTGFRGLIGQVSVALGLNARIGGTVGHYGFGEGLTPVPEPVDLPDVDRSLGIDTAADTDDTDGADAAADAADPAPAG